MASLTGQTIASSYEQLLHTDTDGGGNGNSLLSIKDGDNGTTFALKLATNKVEVIPGSDDANAFEVSKADGTPVLTVDSTNARVGIGTDSPDAPLTVKSSGQSTVIQSYIKSSDSNHLIEFEEGGSSQGIIEVKSAAGGTAKIRLDGAGDTWFNGGSVGIGMTNPSNLLHVVGSGSTPFATQRNTNSGGFAMIQGKMGDSASTSAGHVYSALVAGIEDNTNGAEDGYFAVEVSEGGSNSEKLRVTSSGNVGIGTESPNNQLESNTSSNTDTIAFSASSDTTDNFVVKNNASGNYRWGKLEINHRDGSSVDTTPFSYAPRNEDITIDSVTGHDLHLLESGGKVGIGTASPQLGLHVADGKGALFGDTTTGGSAYVSPTNENTINGGWGRADDQGDLWLNYRGYQDGNTYFRDTRIGNGKFGVVVMVDGSAGYVGIGTTDPDHKLHIEGDLCVDGFGAASNYISMREAFAPDATGGVGFKAVDHTGGSRDGLAMFGHDGLSFWTSQTEYMRIDSSGNVRIGEEGTAFATSPDTRLHVTTAQLTGDSDSTVYDIFKVSNRSAGSLKGSNFGIGLSRWQTTGNNYPRTRVDFKTTGRTDDSDTLSTTVMSLRDDGHVGIGQTSPDYLLDVEGNVASDYVARFFNDGNNANRYGIRIDAGADDGSGTTDYITCQRGDGAQIGYIRNTSGVFALTDVSDRRLKENIRDTEIKGLDAVSLMQVRDFEWKDSGDTCIGGFIAQELKSAFAPAVSGEDGDLEEDGRIKPMGVSRDVLVPVLVKAIQELSAKNDALTARIEALENA